MILGKEMVQKMFEEPQRKKIITRPLRSVGERGLSISRN